MAFGIGILLPLAVGVFATVVGLDRERAFYPTVLIVIASYYGLFAVMGGSMPALGVEAAVFAGFVITAVVGFRSSMWVVVAALAGHALFDLGHSLLIPNPGVPPWWPMFCLSYDLTAAGYLASRLMRRQAPPAPLDEQGRRQEELSGYYRLL